MGTEYAHIAIAPCGCCVAVCSDVGRKFVADFYREMIVNGYTMSRVPWQDYVNISKKQGTIGCICKSKTAASGDGT